MGAKLQALLDLQEIELQLADIRRQLRRKERMVAAQAAKLNAAGRTLAAEREQLQRTQASVDELDLDIKSRSSKINRLREHLNSVRTNKEYAAVLAQLNNEKADVNRLESRALALMEEIERKSRAFREREQARQQEAERLAQLKAQLEQAEQAFADKRAELEGRRAAAAGRLEPDVLHVFERVCQHYDGEVMARVARTRPGRDEFSCEGCHMAVSAERVNALLIRDEVLTCANCGRILYFLE